MRFVPSISPAPTSPDSRRVRGLSATQAIKPVHPSVQAVPYVEHQMPDQQAVPPVGRQNQRRTLLEERRKACRRLHHQPVLEELRSGIDRRRHHLREDDVAEHIDIEA